MCLAIPGRVEELGDDAALSVGVVSFGGVRRRICLELVPEVRVGDYVLVHVGFALSRVDELEAQRIFELLAELDEASRDELKDVSVPAKASVP